MYAHVGAALLRCGMAPSAHPWCDISRCTLMPFQATPFLGTMKPDRDLEIEVEMSMSEIAVVLTV